MTIDRKTAIARAIRVTIFTGRRSWLDQQLGGSLPDGVKVFTSKGIIQTVTICPAQDVADVESEFLSIMYPPNVRDEVPNRGEEDG